MDAKRALVIGAGVSGCAVARLMRHRGWTITLVDAKEPAELAALTAEGIDYCGGESLTAVQAFVAAGGGVTVLSPGIALNQPPVVAAREAGLPCIGELEMAARYCSAQVLAVTGSKGKSSVVKCLADILRTVGISAEPCGNYGTAFSSVIDGANVPHVAVVECSSFQLETVGSTFTPRAAGILNLSPDHLDRHGTMAAYRESKLSLFQNMASDALSLVPAPSEDAYGLSAAFQKRYGHQATTFGVGAEADWRYQAGFVYAEQHGITIDLRGSYFDNEVLGPAAAMASAMLVAQGVGVEQIGVGFQQFQPLAHRMQTVREIEGVRFVDDSKATSLAALLAGVRMAKAPVYLIAGGRLKEPLTMTGKEIVTFGGKKGYIIGECMAEMASAWETDLPIERSGDIERAVEAAYFDARKGGGTVLLSPGTASFDQFKNYGHRGEVFAACVNRLQA